MKLRSLFEPAGAALAPLLTREQAKAVSDRVLAMSTADETRVSTTSTWEGNTRFADGGITTSGEAVNTTVTVRTTVGRRSASATTNLLDDASLRSTVDLAIRLARLSPEDPELMPELAAQNYVNVSGFVDASANLGPESRAAAVSRVIARATDVGKPAGDVFVAGYLEATAGARAIANNRGLFAYHRSTDSGLSTTVRTPDRTGSGWASAGARDWGAIDPGALGARAAQKAVASRNPQAIEPGPYTVVLEPGAVADLIPQLAGALNARGADEGRGPFSKRGGGNKIGEKVADERVTLYSDPADPDLLAQPFDFEGFPVGRRVWIERGILKNLQYSRFWAQKQNAEASGGGGGGGGGGGLPGGLKMAGGTKSTEELIAGTRRGILVTHFFYIRSLDVRTVLLTGLTRDGTFLIEDGRITKSLKNFRWNESPLFLLNKIEEIGRAERTAAGQVMPSIRARDFNFTSLSDAV
ncbi:MAG TPA: TldD/PmbA family protein [Gemmatimonadaceae bacterium]|nr:TldD/PmbA family protein [Gemmatimonadaceae bacterium]